MKRVILNFSDGNQVDITNEFEYAYSTGRFHLIELIKSVKESSGANEINFVKVLT